MENSQYNKNKRKDDLDKSNKTTLKTIKKKDIFILPKKDKSKNKIINKIKIK
jgi:hypothetical protein